MSVVIQEKSFAILLAENVALRERMTFLEQAYESYMRLQSEHNTLQTRTQQLEQLTGQYERALQATNIGIWDWNLETNECYLSPSLKALLGYQDNDIPNDMDIWSSYIHPDDKQMVMDAAHAHINGETPIYEIRHRMVHKDGRIRWFLVRGCVLRNQAGKPIRMSGTDSDITKHVETEEAYHNLVEHSIQGLCIIQDHRIVFVNPTMSEMTGYCAEELFAFSREDIEARLYPHIVDPTLCKPEESSGKPLYYEHRFIRKDGEVRWLEVYAVQIKYCGKQAMQQTYIDITERKEVEEALRKSEERYRSIITTMQEGVILHEKDGSICEWNARARQMLGQTTEKLLGQSSIETSWRAIHEDGTPYVGTHHPSLVALRTGRPCSNEVMGVYKPDGMLSWLLINAQPMFHSETLTPTGVVTTFTDITKLKQIEQALRETEADLRASEQRFRAIFEHSAMGIVLASTEGEIFESNPAFQQLLGYSNEQARHLSYQTITHPDDLDNEVKLYRDMMDRNSHSCQIEKRYIRQDGRIIWCRLTVSLVQDTTQQPRFAIFMIEDITERKHAAEALRKAYDDLEMLNKELGRSRDLLRTLFDGLHDGLVLLDTKGNILTFNQAVTTILGQYPDVHPHHSWFDIFAHTHAFLVDVVTQTLQDGTAHSCRERYTHPKDESIRVLDLQTFPIIGSNHLIEQVVVHIVDVTEQLTLETIAIQHERLAASGALAATIAHEINTPLQSINHCLFLAYDHHDPQQDTYLTMAREEIARISKIVRQFLDLHRPIPYAPNYFDINIVIDRVLTLTTSTLKKHQITIVRDLQANIPPLWGHADQITQVLMNIVLNAQKAMPNGGKLEVRSLLCQDLSQEEQLLISQHPSQQSKQRIHNIVVVEISDTGIGISKEIQDRIFDSFFTTDSGGTGLGLTVSQKIMVQHGGHITVKSIVGEGSTFRLVFPLNYDILATVEVSP